MSNNFFLSLNAFTRHYNKYDFTHAHTTHATKEELHITIMIKPICIKILGLIMRKNKETIK
jgi:hypothetical protein